MDFWNRKKVRKLENRNKLLQDRLDEFEKRMSGERICGTYCKNCENSFKIGDPNANALGFFTPLYGCMLDCKCKDFKKREGEE